MTFLSVNIDHIATIREARRTNEPDPVSAAAICEFAGAHGTCPSLEKQLAFANNELRNEPNYSCFWRATTKSAALSALRRGFGGGMC